MKNPLSWGVLSTAKIGIEQVIPAIQQSSNGIVSAIASRNLAHAQEKAEQLGIGKAYGSYQALLDDPNIDVIYNPLPNHLHVEWTLRALEAGKHVLCEKPLALNAKQAEQLIQARTHSGKLVAEAFMVRFHPQWIAVRDMIRAGKIGKLRCIQTAFSYFNNDPENVRNQAGIGGGGLYDIGCYAIATARFLFGSEPQKVIAAVDYDPVFGTDRLSSGLAVFAEDGQLNFFCSTQLVPYQRVQVFGSEGRIEIEIPFNAPKDRHCRILIDDGKDLAGSGIETMHFPVCDQYTLQAEAFADAVLGKTAWPYPIEDAVANMRVIDALFRSAKSGHWETLA